MSQPVSAQALPCCGTDHYPGINRLVQCYYRYFREHKYLPGASKLSGFDLLSIPLFITLARWQICLLYSWKNLFMSLSIYKGAKKQKSHCYRKHGDHSHALRTPHSECLQETGPSISESWQNTGRQKVLGYIIELDCTNSDQQK